MTHPLSDELRKLACCDWGPCAALRRAADALDKLSLEQGRAWAEAECDRVTANLNAVADERDELRRQLESYKQGYTNLADGGLNVIARAERAEAQAARFREQARRANRLAETVFRCSPTCTCPKCEALAAYQGETP